MVMPLMGFVFMLIVVGGLESLVAAADGKHARLSVCVGPASLFAGLAALPLFMTTDAWGRSACAFVEGDFEAVAEVACVGGAEVA
jgi:hypothetical protein